MTTRDVNLAIMVLGGLWLLVMIATSVRAYNAKRHGHALLFGLPVVLAFALMLTRFA